MREATPLRIWWLVPAASGAAGYLSARASFGGDLTALSQDASVAVALGYLVAALLGPGAGALWIRGSLATVVGLVGGTWALLLGGTYDATWSLLEHLVTPLLVVADVVLSPLLGDVAPGRWWWPVTWLALPLAYLAAYVVGDFAVYDVLDVRDPSFAGTVLGFLAGTLVSAWVLWGVRRAVLAPSS